MLLVIPISYQIADIEQGDHDPVNFVFQGTVRCDVKLIRFAVPSTDLLRLHCDVAHYIEHPSLQLGNLDVQRKMRERLPHVVVGKAKNPLGFRGEPTNVQIFAEHDDGNRRTVEDIDEIVAELRQLLIAVLNFFVDGVQFLVRRFELFFRSLQLFICSAIPRCRTGFPRWLTAIPRS